MARKSNKTSHVLNLLAGEEPVPEPKDKEDEKDSTEAKAEESADKKEPAKDTPEISIVTAINSADDPLSDLIREQLEENLEQAESQAAGGAEAEHGAVSPVPLSIENAPPETVSAEEITPASRENISSAESPSQEDAPTKEASPQETTPTEDALSVESAPSENDASWRNADTDESISKETPPAENTIPQEIASVEEKALQEATPTDEAASHETAPADTTPPREAEKEITAQPAEPVTDASVDAVSSEALPPNHPVVSPDHLNALLYPEDADDDSVHYRFINVMEYIVKDMVLDYMKKFGMCTCERCVVDTTALTLTFCSAKYIVVDKHTVSPLLNYYSSKYTGDVTVALTRACTMVNENPRH